MKDILEKRYGIPCYADTDMDVPSLYPQTPLIRPKQRVCYESMYEAERIKGIMDTVHIGDHVRLKNVDSDHFLFGKIGRLLSVTSGFCEIPTATVAFDFRGNCYDGGPFERNFDIPITELVCVPDQDEIHKYFEKAFKESTNMKNSIPEIKKVIYSGNKTIILWADNTKTIVSCKEGDVYDPYMGFCAAVTKKLFGTNSKIKKTIKQWLPKEE